MRVKLVGIKQQNYDLTREGGPKFTGKQLNCVVLDEEDISLTGDSVTTIKVADDGKFGKMTLEVGKVYICYFNQKKQLDLIKPDDSK